MLVCHVSSCDPPHPSSDENSKVAMNIILIWDDVATCGGESRVTCPTRQIIMAASGTKERDGSMVI